MAIAETLKYDYPHGIMFHHFKDDGIHIDGQGAITAEEFDQLLDHYSETYRLLPSNEWYMRFKKGQLEARDVCLTFDDNLRCQYDIAKPVMEARGLTGFWFVYTSPFEGVAERLEVYRYFRFKYFDDVEAFYTAFFEVLKQSDEAAAVAAGLNDFDAETYLSASTFYTTEDRRFRFVRDEVLGPERYYALMNQMLIDYKVDTEALKDVLWMSRENLRQLVADGHLVGLHSHSHPTRIDHLPQTQQKEEYSRNKQLVTEITGQSPIAMSHPVSRYNDATLEVLSGLGIELGFVAFMEGPAPSPLQVPRIDHTYPHNAAQLARRSLNTTADL